MPNCRGRVYQPPPATSSDPDARTSWCRLRLMHSVERAAHLRSVDTWDSGGGIELDILELDDGAALVVGDETVVVYRSLDDFWAEVEDGDEKQRAVTLLRTTGRPLELTGSR